MKAGDGGSVCESNTPKTSRRCLAPVLKNTYEVMTGVENSLIYLNFLRLTSPRVLPRYDSDKGILNMVPSQFHHISIVIASQVGTLGYGRKMFG